MQLLIKNEITFCKKVASVSNGVYVKLGGIFVWTFINDDNMSNIDQYAQNVHRVFEWKHAYFVQ